MTQSEPQKWGYRDNASTARLLLAAPEIYEALDRAQYMLHAAYRFIEANPIKDYRVFYDEAICDGHCLMDDCNSAIKEARTALAKADGKESK